MRQISIIILLFFFSFPVYAVKGYPYPVAIEQPDGTSLLINIYGDEFFSYKTTADGFIIAQGADGFYYYADYNSGELNISDKRAGVASTLGHTKSIPNDVVSKIRLSKILDFSTGAKSIKDLIVTKANVNIKTIIIPVQFSDRKFATSDIKNKLFNLFNQSYYAENGATGSVKEYFRDNIGTYVNLQFVVSDVITLSSGYREYGKNNSYGLDSGVKDMVAEACSLADNAGLDFSNYDYDGDGAVDNVYIIFAGHNEAEGGGDNTIWPQTWNVSEKQLYFDGVKISTFSCYSEFSEASGTNFAGIGTICHEYCHFLGLLDMYDANGSTEETSNGLFGTTSIMDMGNYNNKGRTPPYFNAVEREMLGLLYTIIPVENENRYIYSIQSSNRAYKFPTSVDKEYYLIEYRDGNKWDEYIGGKGMLIYHVDKSTNMAGSMTARMRWETDAVNCAGDHPCAALFPAVGTKALQAKDAFFPGENNVTTIHSSVNFPIVEWAGNGIGMGLKDILLGQSYMSFTAVKDDSWDTPQITGYSIETFQTDAVLEWSVDKEKIGNWNIVWGLKKNVYADTIVTNTLKYTFTNLSPGEEYYCEIFFSTGIVTGKKYYIEFETTKRVSSFPLIAEADKSYQVGNSIHLRILNLVEAVDKIVWYVNGTEYSSNILNLNNAGKYVIKADIFYPDGSQEQLEKTLQVNISQSGKDN
ncbi:MAG: immune inhibitor A [Bacteroidales bacterium]|nr:immune inhibitor A [Bacteroidales bacterium]